jgi:hypothetical protein
MSKVLTQWEKRKTAIQKSKVRFAVIAALMKIVSKPKAKDKKKDTKAIAEIISKYMYNAYERERVSQVETDILVGTVFSANNDVLYSFGSYLFLIYEISKGGYKRFFDIIKSGRYNLINETVVSQKQKLNKYVESFIKNNRGLLLFRQISDTINNFDSYSKSEYNVKTMDVEKAINFDNKHSVVIHYTKIDNNPHLIERPYLLNLLKIYSSLGIEKVSIKYPIKRLDQKTIMMSGVDANGYTLRCGIQTVKTKASKIKRRFTYYNFFFDGEWSLIPHTDYED